MMKTTDGKPWIGGLSRLIGRLGWPVAAVAAYVALAIADHMLPGSESPDPDMAD